MKLHFISLDIPYDGTMERQNILSYINLSFNCIYFKYFMSKKFFVNNTTN